MPHFGWILLESDIPILHTHTLTHTRVRIDPYHPVLCQRGDKWGWDFLIESVFDVSMPGLRNIKTKYSTIATHIYIYTWTKYWILYMYSLRIIEVQSLLWHKNFFTVTYRLMCTFQRVSIIKRLNEISNLIHHMKTSYTFRFFKPIYPHLFLELSKQSRLERDQSFILLDLCTQICPGSVICRAKFYLVLRGST